MILLKMNTIQQIHLQMNHGLIFKFLLIQLTNQIFGCNDQLACNLILVLISMMVLVNMILIMMAHTIVLIYVWV